MATGSLLLAETGAAAQEVAVPSYNRDRRIAFAITFTQGFHLSGWQENTEFPYAATAHTYDAAGRHVKNPVKIRDIKFLNAQEGLAIGG